MSRRVIVNDEYRYMRIRAAIALDQSDEWQTRWRLPRLSRWIDWEASLFWQREVFYHQRLLDVAISFSKFLPKGVAMIFDDVPTEVIRNSDPGDETLQK